MKATLMPAIAQESPPPPLAPQIQKMLEQRLPQILEDASQIGNAGVVMQNGKIIARGKSGLRRKGADDPVGLDDKWHIGSITKSITATMLGRLVDKGDLSFNDTIAGIWPEQAEHFDPVWRTVTLAQLLHHTSGAKANFGMGVMFDRTFKDQAALDAAREKAVLDMLKKPPENKPGTQFNYSNVGYTIAGVLAAKVAGTSWENLIREEVFEPLGLESAGFGAPDGENPWGHQTKLMVWTQAVNPESPGADNTAILGPAGIVHMNMSDLARYGQLHLALHSGESDYLSSETAKWLHTAPAPISNNHPPYAAGWMWMSFSDDERLSLFHNGSNTMWYALLVNDPKANASFAFATNVGNVKRSEFGFGKLTRDMLRVLDQQ